MHVHLSLYLNIMITISVLLLLAINVFLVWFHTAIQEKNQKFLEMQILLQKESDTVKYFNTLHKQDEKQKILIHDIRKHLFSIAELNEKNETLFFLKLNSNVRNSIFRFTQMSVPDALTSFLNMI